MKQQQEQQNIKITHIFKNGVILSDVQNVLIPFSAQTKSIYKKVIKGTNNATSI